MKENVAAILGSESRMAILKDFDTLLWETTAMRDDDKYQDDGRAQGFSLHVALGCLTRIKARIFAHLEVLGETCAKLIAATVRFALCSSILCSTPAFGPLYVDCVIERIADQFGDGRRGFVLYEILKDVHGMMISFESVTIRVGNISRECVPFQN